MLRRTTDRRRHERVPKPAAFWLIIVSTLLLCLLGLLMVLSATTVLSTHEHGSAGYYFSRQAIFLAAGLVLGAIAFGIGPRRIARLAPLGMILTASALTAVLVLGDRIKGSRRWFAVAGINMQPSEIAKIVVILWAARLLASRAHRISEWRESVLPVGVGFGAIAVLIYLEPDLGTVFVLASVIVVMLIVAEAPTLPLLCGAGVVGVLVIGASQMGYHADRWGFLNPLADRASKNYQLIGSLSSIAGGGLFGVGPGASTAKWGFLPEAHTDGIFAVIGEEMGAIGALSVIVLYLLLAGAGVRAAHDSRDMFGRLMAFGISTLIALQAFINIGVAVGIMPNKGFTLPFVSYGGSSLVMMLIAVGMLLRIASDGGSSPASPASGARRSRVARGARR